MKPSRPVGASGGLRIPGEGRKSLRLPMRLQRAAILLAVALASCKPPLAKTVDRHRGSAQNRIAAIRALTAQVSALPRLTEDRIRLAGPPPNFDNESGNALLLKEERLAATEQGPDADFIDMRRNGTADWYWKLIWLLGCDHLGHVSSSFATPETADRLFGRLEATRYVLVLRTIEYAAPHAATFEENHGRFRGEALLFDLQSPSCLGGVRLDFEGSTRVVVEQGPGKNVERQLETTFWLGVRTALRTTLLLAVPEARMPQE